MIFYRVRRKKNPTLFRKANGTWDKNGKMYDTLGKLRSLLTIKMRSYWAHEREEINDWEIVEYEVTERAVKQVHEVVDPKKLLELLALPPGKH